MTNTNGYTQKEMLGLILAQQEQMNTRIDELHEKINEVNIQKISRSELLAWATVIAVLIAGLSQYMP